MTKTRLREGLYFVEKLSIQYIYMQWSKQSTYFKKKSNKNLGYKKIFFQKDFEVEIKQLTQKRAQMQNLHAKFYGIFSKRQI